MKQDQQPNFAAPQPRYQEQFSLHQAAHSQQQVARTTSTADENEASDVLTDFESSHPQAVNYARDYSTSYAGSQQLNNALKSYLAPLKRKFGNRSIQP